MPIHHILRRSPMPIHHILRREDPAPPQSTPCRVVLLPVNAAGNQDGDVPLITLDGAKYDGQHGQIYVDLDAFDRAKIVEALSDGPPRVAGFRPRAS